MHGARLCECATVGTMVVACAFCTLDKAENTGPHKAAHQIAPKKSTWSQVLKAESTFNMIQKEDADTAMFTPLFCVCQKCTVPEEGENTN